MGLVENVSSSICCFFDDQTKPYWFIVVPYFLFASSLLNTKTVQDDLERFQVPQEGLEPPT